MEKHAKILMEVETAFATKQRKYCHPFFEGFHHSENCQNCSAKCALNTRLHKTQCLMGSFVSRKCRLSKISTNSQKRTLWTFFLLCHSAVIHIEGRHVATCLACCMLRKTWWSGVNLGEALFTNCFSRTRWSTVKHSFSLGRHIISNWAISIVSKNGHTLPTAHRMLSLSH